MNIKCIFAICLLVVSTKAQNPLGGIFDLFSGFISSISGPGTTAGNSEQAQYTLIQSYEGFEERDYPAQNWVSTSIEASNYDAMNGQMFQRLFRYITGSNNGGEKIDMTVPVTTAVKSCSGTNCNNRYTMSFYIPEKHQANPPKPTEDQVFIESRPRQRIYSRTFGGYVNNDQIDEEMGTLRKLLRDADIPNVNWNEYYVVGYNSPFEIFNRRNEIWFATV